MPDDVMEMLSGMSSEVMSDEAFENAMTTGSFPATEETDTESEPKDAAEAEPAAEESTEPAPEPEPEPKPEMVEKKDPLKAMEQELARLRERERKSSEEIAYLKGKAEASKSETPVNPLKEATPETLIDAQIQWEDELMKAREEGRVDDMGKAKAALKQIRVELQHRATEEAVTRSKQGDETSVLGAQIQAITKKGLDGLPSLNDPNSAVTKAVQAQFEQYPQFLGKLGDMGKIVAAGLAIIENPALVAHKANKQLVNNLTKSVERSLKPGAGGVETVKQGVKVAEKKEDFEAQVEAIRNGRLRFADLEGA